MSKKSGTFAPEICAMKKLFQKFRQFCSKIPVFWTKIRKNWKIKYRLIIHNDLKNRDSFQLMLSPRNIFVVVTSSAVLLIVLTAMLIAFTPLRVYVPGYTSPDEYRKYREMARRVDSVELLLAQNQQYIDNFYRVLNDEILPEDGSDEEAPLSPNDTTDYLSQAAHPSEAELELREESSDLLEAIALRQENQDVMVNKRTEVSNLFLLPPTTGTIIGYYSIPQNQYGIDVANKPKTLITSVADGIVIFANYNVSDGNVIIVQHADNVISVYKHNYSLLKRRGARVTAGEPIAEMGSSGITDKGTHLHLELWHNGMPINPLVYLTLK